MSSITILLVEKTGNIKELDIKKLKEEELYKKANLKSKENFNCVNTWNLSINNKEYNISVYGKQEGRAGQENKYEFPPPIDNNLFFGNCLIINKKEKNYTSLTKVEWKNIYDKLYGGFEDLDDDSEDEIESDDDLPKTKSGYVKDDFIVDDDEDEDDDEEDDEEDEEDEDEEDEENDESSGDEKRYIRKREIGTRSKKNIKHVFMCDNYENELSEEEYIE